MKYLKILLFFVLITVTHFVSAQTTCTSNGAGGLNCYDYDTNSYSTITPNGGGGYNTYDYGTNSYGTITPNGGGGYNIYEY